jgi:hypothetical protein
MTCSDPLEAWFRRENKHAPWVRRVVAQNRILTPRLLPAGLGAKLILRQLPQTY